nr:zinc ABC transporter substrate-binding protein [Rhodobaculum claviforme]
MAPAWAQVPAVVADTPVVHSLVAQVMGDLGTPTLLLDRGGDPHSFQLRPSQAQAIASADAVIWVGPELAPWMGRAIEGTGTSGRVLTLLDVEGVTLRAFADGHAHDHDDDHDDDHDHDHDHEDDHAHDHDDHAEAHGHDDDHDDHADAHDHDHDDHAHDDHGHDHDDHGHDHAHDGTDPHAWLDPRNASVWLGAIAADLSALDPDNATIYAANADAAQAALVALEDEVRATLAPVGDAPIVVFHDAYGYFAHRFGVNVAGTIALGDAAAPGAARLTEMRAMLSDGGIACVFPEVNHTSRHVDTVIEGTDTRVGAMLDPAGVEMEYGPELYSTLMRTLATQIADCVTEG